ncbi:hypothetical protein MAE01_21060 [Microbacterium aerolatum]|uniref:Uncharacterized protein n=1 Tax=Microbacterium aerolatum TaxID=153731 RepID=A0A511AFL0_9MICO|nr:hypothetical protein MAE01_21060 [Microbacterium aerolatum]
MARVTRYIDTNPSRAWLLESRQLSHGRAYDREFGLDILFGPLQPQRDIGDSSALGQISGVRAALENEHLRIATRESDGIHDLCRATRRVPIQMISYFC